MIKQRTIAAAMLTVAATAGMASAAPFLPGDVVVYQVGDGSAALTSAGTATFLDEINPLTGVQVQQIAVPTTSSGTTNALVNSGTASSEGLLNLSPNGQFLTFAGDTAAVGTASVSSTSTINRTVAVVNGLGAVNTSTVLTDAGNTNNIRSAVTTDGSTLFVGTGSAGVRSTAVGATTSTQLSTTGTNIRQVSVFGGQLFVSTQSGSAFRIGTVGTGTPTTTGQTITSVPGLPTGATGSAAAGNVPGGFFFADLDPTVGFTVNGVNTGLDTLYIADATSGIVKYGYNGTSFVSEGSVADAGVTDLAGTVTAGVVSRVAVTPTGLQGLTDATGDLGTLSGTLTTVATAGTNTAFRGVAFAPTAAVAVPEPTTLSLVGVAAAGLLGRRRRQA